ncbi:hypothetical protein CLV57_2686 [Mucilaginibacter auburnensis]|uniref:Uncharacterized protein n=1 Tax=Mucilaginibacter auburnensis TaxID=1457233 RepID=A0A2H9VMJ6_9SPHI|nr:hypothetical protein CLV57_2686 [Mucilaginibacter auburnensis]
MVTVGEHKKVLVIDNDNNILVVINHALAKLFDTYQVINCINFLTSAKQPANLC